MTRNTSELLEIIRKSRTPEEYIEAERDEMITTPLNIQLKSLLNSKPLSHADIIREGNLDKTYFYQILSGARNPGRYRLISILVAARCSFDETQQFLKSVGFSQLYARNEKDSVIIFGVMNGFSLSDINCALFELGFETL